MTDQGDSGQALDVDDWASIRVNGQTIGSADCSSSILGTLVTGGLRAVVYIAMAFILPVATTRRA
jgi:hypothetical protein